jgi:hypothetical protein
MIELSLKQREIVDRAANLVKVADRASFRKYTEDLLRAKLQPCANTEVRSACSVALLKFSRATTGRRVRRSA